MREIQAGGFALTEQDGVRRFNSITSINIIGIPFLDPETMGSKHQGRHDPEERDKEHRRR